MMLQQRMNLLNSFLKGNGSHLSSFFKPGSLVIVDLSDPFVEGKLNGYPHSSVLTFPSHNRSYAFRHMPWRIHRVERQYW